MARYASCFVLLLLLLAVLPTPGCGDGRQLQSVSLTPAVADIQNYSTGVVPFAATGTFSRPPSPAPLTSQDVVWCVGSSAGACAGNIAVGASVDQMGNARCLPGFVGTANILAGKPMPVMIPDQGAQLKIFGAAQLVCH
jgi:hypothetical protein